MISVQPTKVTLKAEDVREIDELQRERAQQQQHESPFRRQTQGTAQQQPASDLHVREEIKRRIGVTR